MASRTRSADAASEDLDALNARIAAEGAAATTAEARAAGTARIGGADPVTDADA